MTAIAAIALLLGAVAALSFCLRPSERVIARVGSKDLGESAFRSYLGEHYGAEERTALRGDPAALETALRDYLDTLAIAARAAKLGIEAEPRFKKAVELLELKLLARLMTEKHRKSILRSTQVSPTEVRDYYQQHRSEFLEEPRFTARLLLIYVKGNPAFPDQGLSDAAARRRATEALSALRQGKSWESVAQTFSDDGSTRNRGGRATDRQFGYFPKEVEAAVRTQTIGVTGELIKSDFGYHLVQVESRTLEGTPRPFEAVQGLIEERLRAEKAARARTELMTPFWSQMRFELKEAGHKESSLLDTGAVPKSTVLAELSGKPVLEADFQWFLKDAFLPSQRTAVFSRPSARKELLSSFLDMKVLSAVAKDEKLDLSEAYKRLYADGVQKLLREFVEQRDLAGPFRPGQDPQEDPKASERKYLDGLRKEAQIEVLISAKALVVHAGS